MRGRLAAFVLAFVCGCGGGDPTIDASAGAGDATTRDADGVDADGVDADSADAQRADADSADAGTADADTADAETADAESTDAAADGGIPLDGASADGAASLDAGSADAVVDGGIPLDGASADGAASLDAGSADAVAADAAPPDAGAADAQAADAAPPQDAAAQAADAAPPQDGGAAFDAAPLDAAGPPDAMGGPPDAMGPPDGGGPRRDGGPDAGTIADAGPDAGSCVGAAPPVGAGVAEDRIGATAWSAQHSGNFTSIDGYTAAIGYQGIGAIPGYVRIFVWDTCTSAWTLEQQVVGSNTAATDFFGSALQLDGDRLVVGAAYKAHGTGDSGYVYVFTRSGSTWSQHQLINPPTAAGLRFGWAVAIDGTTIATGAPLGKDPTSLITYSGIVSIFTTAMNGLYQYRTWLAPAELASDDAFGYALALDDGVLVAGAPGMYLWNVAAGTPGKAWIFTGAGTTWTQSAYLTASDGAVNDWFGKSVARAGDTVIIGAPRNDGAGSDAGAAYVFTNAGGTWTQQAKLTASNATIDAYFGFTVAAVSETQVLVGAAGSNQIYSFTYSGGAWVEDAAVQSICGGDVGYTLDVSGGLAISARPGGAIFDLTDPDATCVP